MYRLSRDEILFYTNILCQKNSIEISNIRELIRLFNEEIEIPITETELRLVLENPDTYEELRLIMETVT